MKYLGIIIILLSGLTAQSEDIDQLKYINISQINGVYSMGQELAVLSWLEYRSIDNMNVYLLSYLNDEKDKLSFEVENGYRLHSVQSGKQYAVFVFQNNNEIISIYVNEGKAKPSHVHISPESENHFYGNIMDATVNGQGYTHIVRNYNIQGPNPEKPDKMITIESGYEFIALDKDGNISGRYKENLMEDNRRYLVSTYAIDQGLVVLMEKNDRKNKIYELDAYIYSNKAMRTGRLSLSNNGVAFPSDVISNEGKIIFSGYTLAGKLYDSDKTNGLFVMLSDMNGNLIKDSRFEWDKLKKQLKNSDRGDFIFNGKMNVMVEKIGVTGTGFRIVCESYSISSGNTTAKFLMDLNESGQRILTIHDFIVFETDASGELTSVEIYEKEKMNVDLQGGYHGSSPVGMVNLIKRYQLFPFRKIEGDVISFVNYKNHEGFYSTLNLNTGVIADGQPIVLNPVIEEEVDVDYEEMKSNSGLLTKLDNMQQKVDNMEEKFDKAGNKLEYKLEHIDLTFSPVQVPADGMVTLLNGKTILYKLSVEEHSVFYKEL